MFYLFSFSVNRFLSLDNFKVCQSNEMEQNMSKRMVVSHSPENMSQLCDMSIKIESGCILYFFMFRL